MHVLAGAVMILVVLLAAAYSLNVLGRKNKGKR